MKHAIVFGVSGGIGRAMVNALLDRHDEINIYTPIRNGNITAAFGLFMVFFTIQLH